MGEGSVAYREVWRMVTESLSCHGDVDLSLLGALAKYSDFCNGAEKTARERLSLRYLESAIANRSVSLLTVPFTSTPSSCEDLLLSCLRQKREGKEVPLVVNDRSRAEMHSDEMSRFILEMKSKLPPPTLDLILSRYKAALHEPAQSLASPIERANPSAKRNLSVHGEASGVAPLDLPVPSTPLNPPTEQAQTQPQDEEIQQHDQAQPQEKFQAQAQRNDSVVEEERCCMKCGQGGGRFVRCASTHCRVALHEGCVGDLANKEGSLSRCPFCVYLAYRKEYEQVRRNARAFLGKDTFERLRVQSLTEPENEAIIPNTDKGAAKEQIDAGTKGKEKKVDFCENIGPSRSIEKENQDFEIGGCNRREKELRTGEHIGMSEGKETVVENKNENEDDAQVIRDQVKEKDDEMPPSFKDLMVEIENENENEKDAQVVSNPEKEKDDEMTSFHEKDKDKEKEKEVIVEKKRKAAQVEGTPDRYPKRKRGAVKINIYVREGESTKPRAPKKTCSKGFIHLGSRKKLAFSQEEEEKLKEGVEKYAGQGKGKIPWKDILEFGHLVFDKTRQPQDLKDKWRNMLKKETM